MNSASSSPSKKHAVITIEPLNKDLESAKMFSGQSNSRRPYPSDSLVELQRQQRRRLIIHIFGWFMIILMVALAGCAVYYVIRKK